VHVVLRPIGAPLTLGLSGLGIASVVQSGLALRWYPPGEAREAGLILLAVPFVLQLLACIWAYLARDGAGGAAVGILATTWLAIGLVHISAGAGRNGAMGVLLLAAAGALAASASTVLRSNALAGCVFLIAAVRFVLEGAYELGAPSVWREASGIVGLVLAALALYAIVAFDLEGQARRPLLPTFRRRRATLTSGAGGPPGEDAIYAEPGVRQAS